LNNDPFGTLSEFDTPHGSFKYYRLEALVRQGLPSVAHLPFSLQILLEAVLRQVNGREITDEHVRELAHWRPKNPKPPEVPFLPARVIMQDFTGVPALVDPAAMRSALQRLGGDPARISPRVPVDLVIDHSVQVDFFASSEALGRNAEIEFQRNRERYEFLRWGAEAFANFRVVPPATGIVHQVNLEYLVTVAASRQTDDGTLVFPDSLVGTDSHTTMINGLPEGTTATDLVLTVTQMLRLHGVVGKFVEFFGSGLSSMSLPDRATLANMAPEYGATVGYFPVETSLAGPKRPQDRIPLSAMKQSFREILTADVGRGGVSGWLRRRWR